MGTGVHTSGAAPGQAKGDVPDGEVNTHEGDQTDCIARFQGERKTGQDTALGKAGPLFALDSKGGQQHPCPSSTGHSGTQQKAHLPAARPTLLHQAHSQPGPFNEENLLFCELEQ